MQPESSFDPSGPTSPVAANPERYQSFGEKAVGLDFNPSGDPTVYTLKSQIAAAIDTLHELREGTSNGEVKRMCSVAITELQAGQMWAVKAITWKH